MYIYNSYINFIVANNVELSDNCTKQNRNLINADCLI